MKCSINGAVINNCLFYIRLIYHSNFFRHFGRVLDEKLVILPCHVRNQSVQQRVACVSLSTGLGLKTQSSECNEACCRTSWAVVFDQFRCRLPMRAGFGSPSNLFVATLSNSAEFSKCPCCNANRIRSKLSILTSVFLARSFNCRRRDRFSKETAFDSQTIRIYWEKSTSQILKGQLYLCFEQFDNVSNIFRPMTLRKSDGAWIAFQNVLATWNR